jgi:hypothetical protein
LLGNSANDHAVSNNRKTVTPQDVLNALEDIEFGDFKPRLEAELASKLIYSLLFNGVS